MQALRRCSRSSRRAVVALVGLIGLAGTGCSSGPARPDDPVLAKGQDVYKIRCQSCHGPDGEGIAAPTFRGVTQRLSIEQHRQVVVDGRPGTRMLAFGDTLSDEEIDAVVRYEREVLDD